MTATVPSVPAQPATPGQVPYSDQAFRQAKLAMLACNTTLSLAERLADNLLRNLARMPGAFPARADELDAAPATYVLPAEPPATVTALWDRNGERATRREWGGWWYRGAAWGWLWLLHTAELPLSSAPPAGTAGAGAYDSHAVLDAIRDEVRRAE